MNSAELDPYVNQPIPNQQPLDIPRQPYEELQGELIDPDWSDELDEYSKEYHAFQEIIPDTRTGFDALGDYHAVESFTQEGLSKAITPFRWAEYLQDAVTQYVGNFEYTVGASERDDIAQDIVAERIEACDTMLERYQLEKALELWRQSYGRGYRIRE